jgi:hypothetical protein
MPKFSQKTMMVSLAVKLYPKILFDYKLSFPFIVFI